MQYLLEVLKILDGGMNHDLKKVSAYGEQLAKKLEGSGESEAAVQVRRTIAKAKTGTLELARASGRAAMPVDSESRLSLADVDEIEPESVRVLLPRIAAATVDRFLTFTRSADQLIAHGVGINPSLLLYGPPGCGKTETARFIAGELRLPLVTARLDSLISSFLGSTAKNLRYLFDHARQRPCVLFLDEFDAVAKVRDDRNELGELKRVVVSLLQNIDTLDRTTVLIAATNHHHLLDPAVWRRFAYRAELGKPDIGTREQMFSEFLGEFGDRTVAGTLARISEDLSGADIRTLCDDLKRSAVLDGTASIRPSHAVARLLESSGLIDGDPPTAEARMRALREIDPSFFTQRYIAKIFDVSPSTVNKVLNRQE
jgi:SpoVK/Ycf46/Vps4 family AAA+-type ATPase